jgi:hypothetical protein
MGGSYGVTSSKITDLVLTTRAWPLRNLAMSLLRMAGARLHPRLSVVDS